MKTLIALVLLSMVFVSAPTLADGGCSDGNERGDPECPKDRSPSPKETNSVKKGNKPLRVPPDGACPLKRGFKVDENGNCVCPEGSEEVDTENGKSCTNLPG